MSSAEARPDSVRLALLREAPAIAELQLRVWVQRLAAYPDLLAGLDRDAMTELWQLAISRPPLAECRVLVAVDGEDRLVGFASTTPADDPDADGSTDGAVGEFVIDPDRRRHGHGSRLLNACVDTLRADGFRRARWWVGSTDDQLRHFLAGAGWTADGSHREIGPSDGTVLIKQVRLHTDISTD